MVNQSTFSALADPIRFQVVEALRNRELCAGELAEKCSVSGPAMSRHLRVLRRGGLVEIVQTQRVERDARLRVYRLQTEPFRGLRDWAEHMQAFWTSQLSAFKSYVEDHSGARKRKA